MSGSGGNRPVDAVYPVVFFDGFRLNVRDNGKVISKCLYVALAVDTAGHKQSLGLWIAATESASFWLQVFTDLRNRGWKIFSSHHRWFDGLH